MIDTMSFFLDGKPRVATEEDCNAEWSGRSPGVCFRCGLCGYRFKVGNIWRCLYTNGESGTFEYNGKRYAKYSGNPLVCVKCDGPDVMKLWKYKCDDMYSERNWFFVQQWMD